MSSTNVAKISTRNSETHPLRIASRCLQIARKVIHHLRHQTRPVDRIDCADFVFALEIQIVRHRFNQVLAVIKDAIHRQVVNVGIHQAEHLRLLKRTHSPVRTGHENPNPFFAAHGVFRCTACVSAGSAKNIQFFAAAG